MLAEQIKKDMVQAMKDKEIVKRDVLRVLKGELQRDFITEDEAVIKKVKKMVTNLKETDGDQEEIDILESYLPEQLTRDELIGHARVFIETNELSGPKSMGQVMGYFSKNYAGLYDGKELSAIVRSLLA
jgi:uncharacterized protein YqeY